jgi:hyaluronoglucosaminidase
VELVRFFALCNIAASMSNAETFHRRGIVEGFFGPLWSMQHRKALFQFGAARGMNTYLYAPKDDPYHRARWTEPYPPSQWRMLLQLIREAQRRKVDFVYGFHPGKGLCFSGDKPLRLLLEKAQRFYDGGVRTFAVLFDDIPSRLGHASDRSKFKNSLARAEGTWLQEIQSRQPSSWKNVEWWICPSYYTPDPLLARVFGAFEADFLEILSESLPVNVACFWTGPAVVPERITLAHMRGIARRLKRSVLLWDNYPVNDLSMRDELHIGPLQARDPQLPRAVYGYLNNPLLQEELSFVPLSTCFDYAANPRAYDPERSWTHAVTQRYGIEVLSFWRTIRKFCDKSRRAKRSNRAPRWSRTDRALLRVACSYLEEQKNEKWAREIKPWHELMKRAAAKREKTGAEE